MTSRLSSLQLHGYKTFANLTPFEFPSMVTAIVGPNGSGKSNIADAIRWVLGEQSFSLLRAKRTEDMIFAGSDQKSRAGMASASIAFNNEDNWLPIDFSEVVLTRRAYRDGQNEYLINNQRVRLKDFHDLLAQTGLADRKYTIIGQGLVDIALSIKPDERRKLFEEAAGIGLYSNRKDETIKRLDTTRRNLDRVLDILSEIKPRLRNLERQALKANEYMRLQDDLKIALHEWYGYYWFKAQDELLNAQNRYNEKQKSLLESRRKEQINQEELQSIRINLNSQREMLSSMHEETAGYHQELEKLSKNLAVLDERLAANRNLKKQVEIDVAMLEERIKSKLSIEVTLADDHQRINEEFKNISNELVEIKKAYEIWHSDRSALDTSLREAREELTKAQTAIIILQAQQTELTDRRIGIEGNIPEFETSLEKILRQITGLGEKQEVLNDEVDLTSRQIKDLDDAINSESLALKELQKEEIEQNKQLSILKNEKTRLKVELDMLVQSEQANVNYSAGAKKLLQSSTEKKININLNAMAKHILVPQIYEDAITAALGDVVDLLIIDNNLISAQTLDELTSNEPERVAIIPSKKHSGETKFSLSSHSEKIIGNAIDMVEVDDAYKDTVSSLLSNVIVVKDINSALEIIDLIPETHRVVTLSGELFLTNGIVYLGKLTTTSKLALPRKKADLELSISQHNESIQAVENSLSDLTKKLEGKNQVIVSLESQKNALLLDLSNLTEKKDANKFEVSKAVDHQSWLTNQINLAREKLKSVLDTLNKINESIKDQNAIAADLREKEEALKGKLATLSSQNSIDQLHTLETAVAVSRQALHNSKEKLELHQLQLEENRKTLSTLLTKKTDLSGLIVNIENETKDVTHKMSEINEVVISLREEKELPLKKSLEEIEALYHQKTLLGEELSNDLTLQERMFSEFSLDLTRKSEKLENLKDKIEDDFGLVEFEYHETIPGPTPLPFKDVLIENLPVRHELPDHLSDTIRELKNQIRRIGSINPDAADEYIEVKERYEFLQNQVKDLEAASENLKQVINELDEIMKRKFLATYKEVSSEFSKMFTRLFNGGTARLTISDESDPITSGIDIEARLPGRREQGLVLLSGGERSLTAIALVFALLKVSPTPFCVLDEVDAMLDESNVGRFIELLKELSNSTQFILITHNRNTVQAADVIYGVTMGKDTTSQVISLRLDEVNNTYIS